MPKADEWLAKTVEQSKKLTQRVASVSVLSMLVIAAFLVIDACLRTFGFKPITGLNEVIAMLLGIAVCACLPAGLAHHFNLRIELLGWKRWPRLSSIIEVCSALLLLLFFILLAWQLGLVAHDHTITGHTTSILGWPVGKILWVMVGILIIAITVQVIMCIEAMASMRVALKPYGSALMVLFCVVALIAFLMLIGQLDGLRAYLAEAMSFSPAALAAIWFVILWIGILCSFPLVTVVAFSGLLGSAIIIFKMKELPMD
jgi:hypothetical protein